MDTDPPTRRRTKSYSWYGGFAAARSGASRRAQICDEFVVRGTGFQSLRANRSAHGTPGSEEIDMAVVTQASTAESIKTANAADVFVAFGITGDLAKVMTFRSLYRLERAACSTARCSGVAVDDWSVDHLREHAREVHRGHRGNVDDEVFDRFAARLAYVQGDFGDAATYERVASGDRDRPAAGVLSGDPAVPVRNGDQGPVRGGVDHERACRRGEAVRSRPRLRPRAGGGHPPVHR